MKSYSVDLGQMLEARERRAEIQNNMLRKAGHGECLVCLTLNIAGDVKRTPMTRMLFDEGVAEFEALGFEIRDSLFIDEVTGSEAFWLTAEEGSKVKRQAEAIEDSFAAARLFDFDVIEPDGRKLSRAEARRCLICDRPAAECARSRSHGLDQIKHATGRLLADFCAKKLAKAAYDSLLDELYTTPKPGLVDLNNNGSHADMDVRLFEKSAEALLPYFEDAARLGMEGCGMAELRERGKAAEQEMLAATGGVNTHKGLIYSMGLLLAGMGRYLREESRCTEDSPRTGEGACTGEDSCAEESPRFEGKSCTEYAAALAKEDAEIQLKKAGADPCTNGGAAYKEYGAKGATGEAAGGFSGARYCLGRLIKYREAGFEEPGTLALCDIMAMLEDTNLLHRGGREGLAYVREEASRIAAMPAEERVEALRDLDAEMVKRGLSPGGSADMLALAFFLERMVKV